MSILNVNYLQQYHNQLQHKSMLKTDFFFPSTGVLFSLSGWTGGQMQMPGFDSNPRPSDAPSPCSTVSSSLKLVRKAQSIKEYFSWGVYWSQKLPNNESVKCSIFFCCYKCSDITCPSNMHTFNLWLTGVPIWLANICPNNSDGCSVFFCPCRYALPPSSAGT